MLNLTQLVRSADGLQTTVLPGGAIDRNVGAGEIGKENSILIVAASTVAPSRLKGCSPNSA